MREVLLDCVLIRKSVDLVRRTVDLGVSTGLTTMPRLDFHQPLTGDLYAAGIGDQIQVKLRWHDKAAMPSWASKKESQ